MFSVLPQDLFSKFFTLLATHLWIHFGFFLIPVYSFILQELSFAKNPRTIVGVAYREIKAMVHPLFMARALRSWLGTPSRYDLTLAKLLDSS